MANISDNYKNLAVLQDYCKQLDRKVAEFFEKVNKFNREDCTVYGVKVAMRLPNNRVEISVNYANEPQLVVYKADREMLEFIVSGKALHSPSICIHEKSKTIQWLD